MMRVELLPRSDFGVVLLSMLVLAMLIAGARRGRHVCYLANDPLVERLCGLSWLPSWHTLGRWLRGFDAGGVKALLEGNERLVAEVARRQLNLPPRCLTGICYQGFGPVDLPVAFSWV